MAHRFAISVEEEFQIIDPDTLELRSHAVQLISSAAARGVGDLVKPEMHQSIVETGTKVCENVSELRLELHRTRSELVMAAESTGLQVAAGTHPFSSWIDPVISPGERYQHIVEEMGQLARSLLIFGMHIIHVAMPDKQTTIDMVRYFLPHLLALSHCVPPLCDVWQRTVKGEDTVRSEFKGGDSAMT